MTKFLSLAWQRLLHPPVPVTVGNHRWQVFAGSATAVGLAGHLVLLPVFWLRGIGELAWFNLASVLIFGLGLWVFVFRPTMAAGWHRLAAAGVVLELVLHSVLATWAMGWDTGFHYYFLVLPFIALFSPFGDARTRALMALFAVPLYAALWLFASGHEPPYRLTAGEQQLFLFFNFALLFAAIIVIAYFYERAATDMEQEIDRERQRSDQLLLNTLPVVIAQKLKDAPGQAIARRHADVSVLFCDIVGFTRLSERLSPEDLVQMLNRIFTAFDLLADEFGVEKIKTIGDAYMVAAGLPEPRADHAPTLVRLGLAMVQTIRSMDDGLDVRVGIHSGPAVAGVIGRRKFAYDLWGDAVNTAARMESHGVPGRVQVSEVTAGLLGPEWTLERRSGLALKGKGEMTAYLVGVAPPG